MNRSIEMYAGLLKQLAGAPDLAPPLPDLDLDTGEKTQPGAYALTDHTYARLLHEIATGPQRTVTPGLKQNILDYYSANATITTQKNRKAWVQVMKDLDVLRGMAAAARSGV